MRSTRPRGLAEIGILPGAMMLLSTFVVSVLWLGGLWEAAWWKAALLIPLSLVAAFAGMAGGVLHASSGPGIPTLSGFAGVAIAVYLQATWLSWRSEPDAAASLGTAVLAAHVPAYGFGVLGVAKMFIIWVVTSLWKSQSPDEPESPESPESPSSPDANSAASGS